jgi:hypothetical protein
MQAAESAAQVLVVDLGSPCEVPGSPCAMKRPRLPRRLAPRKLVRQILKRVALSEYSRFDRLQGPWERHSEHRGTSWE